MSKLEIRDLYYQATKDEQGNVVEKPEQWDAVTLDVEVDAEDYLVTRSKVGRYLIYTIKYQMVEDPDFSEGDSAPAPPAGITPKRWSKMYRCWFDLNYRKPTAPGAEATKPISHEEKYEYPEVPPEKISKDPEPEGKPWPKDPFYRLYKNYKYPDPTPPENATICEKTFWGAADNFVQKLTSLATYINTEQKIRQTGEEAPPPPPEGQEESAEEIAKTLKNYIKLHDIKDPLKAEYEVLTLKDATAEEGNQPTCQKVKTEKKKIQLRSLKCTEENKDEFVLKDLPIVRF